MKKHKQLIIDFWNPLADLYYFQLNTDLWMTLRKQFGVETTANNPDTLEAAGGEIEEYEDFTMFENSTQ